MNGWPSRTVARSNTVTAAAPSPGASTALDRHVLNSNKPCSFHTRSRPETAEIRGTSATAENHEHNGRRADRGAGLPRRPARYHRPVMHQAVRGAARDQWEHAAEIRQAFGYRAFSEPQAAAELRGFLAARAWTRIEPSKAMFDAAAGWLREHRVLLPGVHALAKLVAEVRTPRRSGCGRRSARPPSPPTRGCHAGWATCCRCRRTRGSASWSGCGAGRRGVR